MTELNQNSSPATGCDNLRKVFVVIPAYNEEQVIGLVIDEVKAAGNFWIVVVDDGSEDNTFSICKADTDVIVIRHKINRGKGAAVKTGVAAAKAFDADIIVTLDGDGQHDPQDISALIEPIFNDGVDVILGTRMTDPDGMPLIRKVANYIGNFFTWCFYGIWVSDSQSGFRAFSKYSASIINTKADKYEYDSKIIREINNNKLRFKEVPVKVRYTGYSMGKKNQQGFTNGIRTLFRMIWGILS